jgi:hypothetical protein
MIDLNSLSLSPSAQKATKSLGTIDQTLDPTSSELVDLSHTLSSISFDGFSR